MRASPGFLLPDRFFEKLCARRFQAQREAVEETEEAKDQYSRKG